MGIITLAAISFLTVYTIVGHVECKLNRTMSNEAEHLFIDGIDVSHLSEKELNGLLEAEDEQFMDSLDIWIGKQTLRKKHRLKRIPPVFVGLAARVAWRAGRLLYRSLLSSVPKITRSGPRLTKQYFKRGGYRTAYRDFQSFKPTNIEKIKGNRGYHGDILNGKYKLNVRPTSSSGRPTLELRPGKGNKSNVVRKLRYMD